MKGKVGKLVVNFIALVWYTLDPDALTGTFFLAVWGADKDYNVFGEQLEEFSEELNESLVVREESLAIPFLP